MADFVEITGENENTHLNINSNEKSFVDYPSKVSGDGIKSNCVTLVDSDDSSSRLDSRQQQQLQRDLQSDVSTPDASTNEDNVLGTEEINVSISAISNDGVQEVTASDTQEVSNDSPEREAEPIAEETAEQRRIREERESQELAWELMRQEQQEMYNLQMQYMQQNAEALSEEDRAVMEQIMGEVNQVDSMYAASRDFHRQMLNSNNVNRVNQRSSDNSNGGDEQDEDDADGSEVEGEEGNLDNSDNSNWDYERLLSLGEALGGQSVLPPTAFLR